MADSAPTTTPLPADKARFLTESLGGVQGYLIPSTALYLAGLEAGQRGRVAGGIAEIGVHRGKSFITMALGLPASDTAVAIDIFDAQHLNEEATSVNALRDFKTYLDRFGMTEGVEIVEGSSLDLEDEGFLDAGPRFRLFSVDGGHMAHHVLNDLRLAEKTLAPGGVVAADDLLHQHYLGVITGVFQYLDSGGSLVPYALVPNKLLLTDAASVEMNKALMRELFEAGLDKADVPFHDARIDVYGQRPWIVTGDDGSSAPLQQPATEADKLRGQIEELTAQAADLDRQLTRARARVRRQRARLRALKAAGGSGTGKPAGTRRGLRRRSS